MLAIAMDGAARPEEQDSGADLESKLTQAQRFVIEALAAGKNMTEAGAAGDVSRKQVYRWLKQQPEFVAALNKRKREVVDTVQRLLLAGLEAAAATVTNATTQGDVKTARWLLERTRALRFVTPTEEEEDPEYLRQRAREREEHQRSVRALFDALSPGPADLITPLAALDDEALQRELRSQPRMTLRILDQAARIHAELAHALDRERRKAETPATMSDAGATPVNDGLRPNLDGPGAPAPDGRVEGV